MVKKTKYSNKYLPKTLSKSDKKKQKKSLNKSRKDYLSKKYYNNTFDVYDPYFFLLFLYVDYLGNRFRNDKMGFLQLVF